MKATKIFAIITMALLMIAMPSEAQSRKDKKAAKKEKWEMEQKQQREEAELRHQMRMDSLRAAQQEQEEAKAKAKAEQAKREAEEARLSQRKLASEDPCQAYDDADWFYATGSRRFKGSNRNLTATALLRSTRLQLMQKLSGKYQAVIDDYFDQMETEDEGYAREHIESAGRMVMQQMVNETYEVCRETTDFPDNEGYYTMYMSIKISKKELVENVVKKIDNDEEMLMRFKEKQFRDSAFKVFQEQNNP